DRRSGRAHAGRLKEKQMDATAGHRRADRIGFDALAFREQEARPGVDQRDEILHKMERAESKEEAHAVVGRARHPRIRPSAYGLWRSPISVLFAALRA